MRISLSVAITSLGLMLITACSLPPSRNDYRFRALDTPQFLKQAAKLEVAVLDETFFQETAAGRGGVFTARFRGSLIQLFGKALHESTDGDAAFDYVIEAQTADGQTVVLTAYEGPSGPAIGGVRTHPLAHSAAEALFQRIAATPPADFAATVYDADTDHTVTYGCTDGSCYWHEVPGKHLD